MIGEFGSSAAAGERAEADSTPLAVAVESTSFATIMCSER